MLSPLLFILVLEEATRECGIEGLWELLYAVDVSVTVGVLHCPALKGIQGLHKNCHAL